MRHLQDIISVAVWYLENAFTLHKTEVQAMLDKQIPGTLAWYREKTLAFQYNHTVVLIDYRPGYATEDADAQIIKYCHCTELITEVVIKVAKENRDERLTSSEKDALLEYLHAIKYPGTPIHLVDQNADIMTVELDVYVDHQLMSSDGESLGVKNTYPVQEAIISFINESEFGGKLVVNSLVDIIQAVDGVKRVSLKLIMAETDTNQGEPIIIFNLAGGIDLTEYESEAGHFIIDEADLTINYL